MLISYPTKNGTGISIFGDYGDLSSLYRTVHKIATTLDENNEELEGQSKLLMNLAYEIRKAYSGQMLTNKIKYDFDVQELNYFGFQLVWTDILIFISALRHNAGYIQTDKEEQANLYMLEYIIEKALFDYDPEGANDIKHLIAQGIKTTNKYVFIIYQTLHVKFVTEKPGKKRFRSIPLFIMNHFAEWRHEYKDIIHSLEVSAKEQKCEVADLELDDNIEIIW